MATCVVGMCVLEEAYSSSLMRVEPIIGDYDTVENYDTSSWRRRIGTARMDQGIVKTPWCDIAMEEDAWVENEVSPINPSD